VYCAVYCTCDSVRDMNTATASPAVFNRDLAKMNAKLIELDALVTYPATEYDVEFTGIDASKAPASLLSAYKGLLCYGYANGLI